MAIKERIKPEGYRRSFLISLGGLLIMGIGLCSAYGMFKGFSLDPTFELRAAWSAVLVTIVWSLGFVLAGIWFLKRSRLRHDTQKEFEEGLTETMAKVLKRYIEHVETYDDEYDVGHVVVQFETKSGQVTLHAKNTGSKTFEKIFDEISPAKMVKITYSASDHRIALLEGEYK